MLETRPTPGLLLVVSSPSGAGKTTLCRHLVSQFATLSFSVSFTTRPPREGERDGIDYHFIDRVRFDQMIKNGELAEYAEVHGNLYGTGMSAVRAAVEQGEDVLFDIDYQGGRQIRARFPDAILIFVLPPSIEILEQRLRQRATDSDEVIGRRLAKAREEMEHYSEYDFVILNDNLTRSKEEMSAVYVAAHATMKRRAGYAEAMLGRWRRTE